MIKYKRLKKILGTTPQTNGSHEMEKYWNSMPDCGYDKHYEHEVVYASGPYDGSDEQWAKVGIPYSTIHKIYRDAERKNFKFGWTFTNTDNTKRAIISFSDPDYAFWFKLKNINKHNKQRRENVN